MKKILFLMVFLSGLFVGCSDDGDEEEELLYLQVKVTGEDNKEIYGNVYLFYIENHTNLQTPPRVNLIGDVYVPYIPYKGSDGDNHHMYPVSDWGKERDGELHNFGDGYSVETFYWDKLSTLYGTPKKGCKYALCVVLEEYPHCYVYYEFTMEDRSVINMHIPDHDGYHEFIDADIEITIVD